MKRATLFDMAMAPGKIWRQMGRPGKFADFAAKFLRDNGCKVMTKGWPDLLVLAPGGSAIAIELKQGSDKVRPHQKEVHKVLNDAGLLTWCISDRAEDTPFTSFIDNVPLIHALNKIHPREDFEGLGI